MAKSKKEKKRKKNIQEGILNQDLDARTRDDVAQMAVGWILDHINDKSHFKPSAKDFTINSDDTISIDNILYLTVNEDMPDYVNLKQVASIYYKVFDKSISDITLRIPEDVESITIMTHSERTPLRINFQSDKKSTCGHLTATGDVVAMNFPKNFTCRELDLEHLENLDVKTLNIPKCDIVHLPRTVADMCIRKQLGIKNATKPILKYRGN
jgi:hypothetical protein